MFAPFTTALGEEFHFGWDKSSGNMVRKYICFFQIRVSPNYIVGSSLQKAVIIQAIVSDRSFAACFIEPYQVCHAKLR
jgi:hypothetical protein